jgi:hypothetical protein
MGAKLDALKGRFPRFSTCTTRIKKRGRFHTVIIGNLSSKRLRSTLRRGGGTLAYLAYILAIIGGILMIIFSILGMLSYAISIPFQSPIGGLFGSGIITLILGIVAVIGSKRASQLLWAIILIIVGFLGGGIGGLLVLIGGILGLLSHFI